MSFLRNSELRLSLMKVAEYEMPFIHDALMCLDNAVNSSSDERVNTMVVVDEMH
jgi:hypothetical protein